MAGLKWYVVKAVSGQEKKAKSYLETEIKRRKLEDYVPQILIPTEKVYEIRNGKKVQRERSSFSGYIFVNADLSHKEVMPVITSIPGILGFLGGEKSGISKEPIPLRASEISRILGKVEEDIQKGETLQVPFIVGEEVVITDDAFKGFKGVIEEVFEDRKKLKVVVAIFGRSTPMELSYAQVQKVD
ncbi:MAG: transcription termination/antitermination protein NusG [Microscillaceae bacterium]|nr:transcription termination/antitermination protein NusG [Microscillaceae bacterium]MDW8460704.1 transcription termination/antitermination protein NusG [Cytophagales bacterium]